MGEEGGGWGCSVVLNTPLETWRRFTWHPESDS